VNRKRLILILGFVLSLASCTKRLVPTSTKPIVFTPTTIAVSQTFSLTATQILQVELLTPSATQTPISTPTRWSSVTPRPTMTVNPTLTRPPVSPPPSPTIAATFTETQEFIDPRKSLAPGQYVVFWRANTWYIQGVDGASPERLLPEESPNSVASLSPDGKRIAYVDASDQLSIYGLDTGKLTIYPLPNLVYLTDLDWSPDSHMLMFSGTNDPWDFLAHYSIDILLLDTGEMRQLVSQENFTQEGNLTYGGYGVSWSPDGRWIGFWGRLHGQTDYIDNEYYVMDSGCIADPNTCMEKSKLIASVSVFSTTWTPDGLLEFTCTIGDKTGPCLVNVNTSGSLYLLPNHPELSNIQGELAYLRWSPDGKYIVFRVDKKIDAGYSLSEMKVVRADGSGLVTKLTNAPEKNAWLNSWSPDGQYAAFSIGLGFEATQDRNGLYQPLSEIYIYSVTDNKTINLTNTPTEREDFAFWLVIPNKFQPGNTYQITTDGNNLSLRASPSLDGAILEKLKTGDMVTILEGPVQADKYTWWKMRTADGKEGWAVDVPGWYTPVGAAATLTLTPTP
jgi:Tol biopolymer transport system component